MLYKSKGFLLADSNIIPNFFRRAKTNAVRLAKASGRYDAVSCSEV